MTTTIQISDQVKKTLDKMKLYERQPYNDIIEMIIEDDLELSQQTIKELEARKKEKSVSHAEVKQRFGL